MDLSNPLRTVTPTLDASVLQVLAATTGWCTAAEVHRRMKSGSDEGVRKVLARLVDQGIVLMDIPARYPLYLLNRDHVAYQPIVELTSLRRKLIDRIKAEIMSWDCQPLHAGVFGSFARGEAGPDSDIDVLLVRPDGLVEDEQWLEQIERLERNIEAWTGNPAHVVDATRETVSRMKQQADPLYLQWRADDIPVTDTRLIDVPRLVP